MERKTIEVSWESSGVWNLEAILEEKMRELKRETSRVPVFESLVVTYRGGNLVIKYEDTPEAEGFTIGVLAMTSSDGEIRSRDVSFLFDIPRYVAQYVKGQAGEKEGPFKFKCAFRLKDISFYKKDISKFKKMEPPTTISIQWVEKLIRGAIAPDGTAAEDPEYYEEYKYEIRVKEGRLDDLPPVIKSRDNAPSECIKDISISTHINCDENFTEEDGYRVFFIVKNGDAEDAVECWEPDDDEFTLTQYIQEFQRIHPEFEILYAVFVCVDDSYSEYVQVTDEDYVIIPISKQEAQDE